MNEKLRISTMTQIGKLSVPIDLRELYLVLDVNNIIRYIEYGDEIPKGDSLKKEKKEKKEKKAKKKKEKITKNGNKPSGRKPYFYNQVTLHVYIGKIINMKIFNNGRIQMTGLKSETMGTEAIQHLLDILLNLKEETRIKICLNDTSIPKLIETNIVLINSDFDIGFKIDRENLHRSIIEKGYYSSFEPCIYPGVNIKYYHHPLVKNYGICSCDNPCNCK